MTSQIVRAAIGDDAAFAHIVNVALREINDHIRPEEIEALRSDIAKVGQELGNARVRLDAVRLLIGG